MAPFFWKGVFMVRSLSVCTLFLLAAGNIQAHGLLIPVEKSVPPLAMLNHIVNITIEDQVATTHVEQSFRNHTDRNLEATYVFPIPKGAGVQKFTMWVDGKEVAGELVEAGKARQIYTDIVRRTQDPGLLEYMGNNVLRLRIFPVPAHADQKVTLRFSSIAPKDGNLVEYIYPLKTDGKSTRTLEKFSIQATIKGQHPIQNVYSPTHAITLTRSTDREVKVTFDRDQALLDKDFQIYYALGDQDIGLTTLTHRPISGEPGYVMMLLSPRVEMSQSQLIPQDMVMVLDTSGSMRGPKMDQARKALQYCLSNLNPQDRFGLINFATVVNKYRDTLVDANKDHLEQARKWVDALEATGGTAIDDALAAALQMRTSEEGRGFTIVFFTDGCPTIGETNPDKILKNVATKNSANTRIFSFGVGDDVNANFLDQLSDRTRALSAYVRPAEDIELKVSSLYSKISHPVLANVKVNVGPNVQLQEVYPPQLPDLFAGGQVVVLGRYAGQGSAAIKLSGTVGKENREFVYETTFPDKADGDKGFVEHLWARRKVGYLLDQIRNNGEKKELVEETIALAKKYGVATPYTSYLIVPDGPVPVARGASPSGKPDVRFNIPGGWREAPALALPPGQGDGQKKVADFAKGAKSTTADLPEQRAKLEEDSYKRLISGGASATGNGKPVQDALDKKQAFDQTRMLLQRRDREAVQTGKLGVDLAVQMNNLRNQSRIEQTAQRNVNNRNCLEIGGVWIDEGFDPKMPAVTVKAMSDAYFRILEKHPKMKDVFQLGNYLVWVTPNGTALIIDTTDGKEKLDDTEIDKLFVKK
jgi:Ca-activated chloride channel homolog